MKFLALPLLVFAFLMPSFRVIGQEYFYFGNSNLVATGPLEGGKKTGSWKVYQRKVVEDNPHPSDLAVPLTEVEAAFELRMPIFRIDLRENIPTGVMEEFFPGGQVKKIVNYREGQLDGDFFEFNKEGELLFSGTYFQGQRTGDWIVYRSDGSKKSEYTYLNNLLDGFALSYYPSGQLAERISFNQGVLQGAYQAFFPDGRVQQSLEFANGVENGPLKQYHADGMLALSCSFFKGLLEGNWEKYSSTGQLEARGAYRQGERDGDWEEIYSEVPGFFWKGQYLKGSKEGNWLVQDATGFVHQEETYRMGSLIAFSEFTTRSGLVLDAGGLEKGDGKRFLFDPQGNRLEKGRYSKGLRTGMWYTYFLGTNLVASSGSYVAGQKRGTWKQYDLNSRLISEEVISPVNENTGRTASSSPTAPSPGSTRSYMPQQTSNGLVLPQFRLPTPDGGLGFVGPGIFPLGN